MTIVGSSIGAPDPDHRHRRFSRRDHRHVAGPRHRGGGPAGRGGRRTTTLAAQGGNIATIKVSRRQKGGNAIHIYELDEPVGAEALAALLALPRVQSVRAIGRVDG